MSAIEKIKENYGDLKETQRKIADYFLETDVNGVGSSIDEIADRVGTSVASVSRFCKRLDFENFGQFKIALSREKTYEPDRVLPIFKPKDDADVIIHKAFSEAVTNLQDTEGAIDFETIKSVAALMRDSRMIYFFGMGGSGGVAKLGELLFGHLGCRTLAISDPYEMAISSGHIQDDEMAFGISHTGRNKAVCESIRTAAGRGAATVALTNYRESLLAVTAGHMIETACYEGRVHFAQSNSIVAQMTVLNSLYLLTASKSSEEIIREVDQIEESCRRSLRIKNNTKHK